MSESIEFEDGGYAFLEGVYPYSQGVIALPGFALERVRFTRALPLEQGFAAAGRDYVLLLDADIDDFFDNVDRDLVVGRLSTLLPAELPVRLVRLWLDYAIWDGVHLTRPKLGLPQGAVVSPMPQRSAAALVACDVGTATMSRPPRTRSPTSSTKCRAVDPVPSPSRIPGRTNSTARAAAARFWVSTSIGDRLILRGWTGMLSPNYLSSIAMAG